MRESGRRLVPSSFASEAVRPVKEVFPRWSQRVELVPRQGLLRPCEVTLLSPQAAQSGELADLRS